MFLYRLYYLFLKFHKLFSIYPDSEKISANFVIHRFIIYRSNQSRQSWNLFKFKIYTMENNKDESKSSSCCQYNGVGHVQKEKKKNLNHQHKLFKNFNFPH